MVTSNEIKTENENTDDNRNERDFYRSNTEHEPAVHRLILMTRKMKIL